LFENAILSTACASTQTGVTRWTRYITARRIDGAHICFGKHAPVMTRLLLFDKKQFCLVECVKGTAAQIDCCLWTAGGPREFLKDFLPQNWLSKVIGEACERCSVIVGCDSFLGSGAHGYVFKARRCEDGREIAMKVSGGRYHAKVVRLQMELERMKVANKRCPDASHGC
jgi:hypothetical protein